MLVVKCEDGFATLKKVSWDTLSFNVKLECRDRLLQVTKDADVEKTVAEIKKEFGRIAAKEHQRTQAVPARGGVTCRNKPLSNGYLVGQQD